jgi:hypothetical protein
MTSSEIWSVTAVGLITLVGGLLLVIRHFHVFRLQFDQATDVHERRYLVSQVRRRALTGLAIAVLGVVLCCIPWFRDPVSFTLFVIAALVLLLVIGTLAMLDLLAVRLEMSQRRELSDAAQLAMKRYAERLKEQKNAAQRPPSDPEE